MQTRMQSIKEILIAQSIGSVLMFLELWLLYGAIAKSVILVLVFKTQSTTIFYILRRINNRRHRRTPHAGRSH